MKKRLLILIMLFVIVFFSCKKGVDTDIPSADIPEVIGEQYFDLLKLTSGKDFAECLDSSIIVIGSTRESHYNPDYTVFISKFDKNLKNQWVKYLNNGLNSRLGSIERLSDGNFIVSGLYDNANNDGHFALSKIDPLGKIIWNKIYPQTNGYSKYSMESSDGGIMSIGVEDYFHISSGNTVQIVTVLKTDVNGNFEWKKQFIDEWLMGANNIINTDGGFIFASSTRGENGSLSSYDSLVITKIGYDSQIIWKKAKEWQIPDSYLTYNVRSSRIVKNNNSLIVVGGNKFVMIFNSEGNFVKRNYSDIETNNFITKLSNDEYIIGGGEIVFENIRLNGFDVNAEKSWKKSYGNRNTTCMPPRGYGTMTKTLLNGELLFLGVSYKECMDHDESSMLLVKINNEGVIQ